MDAFRAGLGTKLVAYNRNTVCSRGVARNCDIDILYCMAHFSFGATSEPLFRKKKKKKKSATLITLGAKQDYLIAVFHNHLENLGDVSRNAPSDHSNLALARRSVSDVSVPAELDKWLVRSREEPRF